MRAPEGDSGTLGRVSEVGAGETATAKKSGEDGRLLEGAGRDAGERAELGDHH